MFFVFFSFHHWVCHATLLWCANFELQSQLMVLWEFVSTELVAFLLLFLKLLSLSLTFAILNIICLGVVIFGSILFGQYMNYELPDVQACFRKGRGIRDQIANILWIIKKARKFQKNIYFCFINYTKAFDCVDHHKLWKIMKEMGIPNHFTCLPGGSDDKASACNMGDPGLIHGSGRFPGEENGIKKMESR